MPCFLMPCFLIGPRVNQAHLVFFRLDSRLIAMESGLDRFSPIKGGIVETTMGSWGCAHIFRHAIGPTRTRGRRGVVYRAGPDHRRSRWWSAGGPMPPKSAVAYSSSPRSLSASCSGFQFGFWDCSAAVCFLSRVVVSRRHFARQIKSTKRPDCSKLIRLSACAYKMPFSPRDTPNQGQNSAAN